MNPKRAELYKLADALIAEMERQGVLSIVSTNGRSRLSLAAQTAPVARLESENDPGDNYRPNLGNAAVR